MADMKDVPKAFREAVEELMNEFSIHGDDDSEPWHTTKAWEWLRHSKKGQEMLEKAFEAARRE